MEIEKKAEGKGRVIIGIVMAVIMLASIFGVMIGGIGAYTVDGNNTQISAEKTSCIELETVRLTVTGVPGDDINVASSPLTPHVIFRAGVEDTPVNATNQFNHTIDADGVRTYAVKFNDTGTFTIKVTVTDSHGAGRDGEYDTVNITVSEKGITFDLPMTVVIGQKLTIRGTANSGTTVDIYVDKVLYNKLDDLIIVDGEFSEEVTVGDLLGMGVPGTVRLKAWIDSDIAGTEDGNTDTPSTPADGEAAFLLTEPILDASQPRSVITEGEIWTVEGTATGVGYVDIILVGPKGWTSSSINDIGIDKGFYLTSVSVYDNEFTEDITMENGIDTGLWVSVILHPGCDGEYTRGPITPDNLYGYGVEPGMNQSQILDGLEDGLNQTGSDDLWVILAFQLEAAPIYVPDNYTKIQWAVDNATEGDTIIVRDGTYTENVDVNKDHLTIKSANGADSTIVQAANLDDHVFEVIADYVNISGFTVKGATEEWHAGIYLYYADYCNISDNTASNNLYGIHLSNSNNNSITNNSANSNNDYGFIFINASYNTIDNNTVCNNADPEVKNSGFSTSRMLSGFSSNTLIPTLLGDGGGSPTSTPTPAPSPDGGGGGGGGGGGWYSGILLSSSDNNLITTNNISNNGAGMYSHECKNNTLSSNTVNSNNYFGIFLWDSGGNTLTNNTMSANSYHFGVHGYNLSHYIQNIDTSNTVDGKPVYYWVNQQNQQIPNDAGYVGIVNSTNITVGDLTLTNNFEGVLFAYTSNSGIENITVNSNSWYGIYFDSSINNKITNNNVSNNFIGISLTSSINNKIYLNNFINNADNFYSSDSNNIWNSTEKITYTYNDTTYTNYLGNYWGDYVFAGNDTNKDGIGDTPYSIDSDKDNYPLMMPWENYIRVILPSSTGTGNIEITTSNGYFGDATCVNESDLPLEGKPSLEFPHGFFSFRIAGLTPSQNITITSTLPLPVPTTAEYWKFQDVLGWYEIPMGSNDGDNVITIQITDGGIGDADGIANGVIIDPGGPGVPLPTPSPTPTPTRYRGGGGGAPRDSDGDGLLDIDEMLTYKTEPQKADTDGGGVNDGEEVARGTDPLDPTDDIVVTPTPSPTPMPAVTPMIPSARTPTPSPMPTPTPPGFEAVLSIVGLLVVAYLVLRRR